MPLWEASLTAIGTAWNSIAAWKWIAVGDASHNLEFPDTLEQRQPRAIAKEPQS